MYFVTDLTLLPGYYNASANRINSKGDVVGVASLSVPPGFVQHAFLYTIGVMIDLGTLGGTYSDARAINYSDAVVGTSSVISSDATQHAFLFDNTGKHDLGTLPNGFGSGASAINKIGEIVGQSNTMSHPPFYYHAF